MPHHKIKLCKKIIQILLKYILTRAEPRGPMKDATTSYNNQSSMEITSRQVIRTKTRETNVPVNNNSRDWGVALGVALIFIVGEKLIKSDQ